MNSLFQNPKFRQIALAAKPWVIFIGVFMLLKVTGLGGEISFVAQRALLKAGVMDIDPGSEAPREQIFSYDFALKDLEGRKLDMADLKGKVIFINLWATWCGPCRAEMPSIQKLYDTVDKEKVAFVMLSLDEDGHRAKIEKYIREKQFSFPVYQPLGPLPKLLKVNTIPTTFIISPDGKVKTKNTGMANYDTDEMREFLEGM